MRKYIASLLVMLLVGCSTVQPRVVLPEASQFMQTPCAEQLEGLPSGATKADVLSATANNGKEFYTCSRKVEDWNRFYNDLRKTVN